MRINVFLLTRVHVMLRSWRMPVLQQRTRHPQLFQKCVYICKQSRYIWLLSLACLMVERQAVLYENFLVGLALAAAGLPTSVLIQPLI